MIHADGEGFFRTLIEYSADLVILVDKQGTIYYSSPSVTGVLGYSNRKIVGSDIFSYLKSDDQPRLKRLFSRFIRRINNREITTLQVRSSDGKMIHLEVALVNLLATPPVHAIMIMCRDISDRNSMENALRLSEARYQTIFDHAPLGIYQTMPEGNILTANSALAVILGFSSVDELMEHTATEFYADVSDREKLVSDVSREMGDLDREVQWKKKDGSLIWVQVSIHAIRDEKNRLVSFEGFVRDITSRHNSRRALQRTAALRKRLLDVSTTILSPLSFDEVLVQILKAMKEVLAFDVGGVYLFEDKHRVLRMEHVECSPKTLPLIATWQIPFGKSLMGETLRTGKALMVADAQKHPLSSLPSGLHVHREHFIGIPLHEVGGQSRVFCLSRFSDIPFTEEEFEICQLLIGYASIALEHARLFHAREVSEERYRRFFEDDLTGDYVCTPDGRILACNPAFIRMFGFRSTEDALTCSVRSLFTSSGSYDDFLRHLQVKQKLENHEIELHRLDGSPLNAIQTVIAVFDRSGALVEFKGYIFDETERKSLEDQLLQAQKMESIGALVGGIAHDFNNILNNIFGFALQLKKYTRDPARVMKYADTIERSASRGGDITAQLLSFVRQTKQEDLPVDIANVVDEITSLCEETFPRTIAIAKHMENRYLQVMGDRGQLYQVLLNLAVNARDAMPSGGILTISLRKREVGREVSSKILGTSCHQCVEICVTDSGIGIPDEVRSKIFDPLFTTKGKGQGTGLGLSTAYSIVRNHKGAITVQSEPDKGSSFYVHLPLLAQEPDKKEHPSKRLPQGDNELILLVDDDNAMQELGKELLEEDGYRVIVASDGVEAVDLFRQHGDTIELVILDLVMPRMDGGQTFLELRKIRPSVRAFFCSGYAGDDVIASLVAEEKLVALQKPFKPRVFLQTVHAILGKSDMVSDTVHLSRPDQSSQGM